MLCLKQNFYITGAIALTALVACSSDSPTTTGSTTIPNATDEISSSSENTISSSADNIIESPADDIIISSSSVTTTSSSNNDSIIENLLAPFTANNEKVLQFDSHVIAYNTALSPSCENIMVSYDENEMIIPVKPISGEAIAECFPKTAPVLEENHLTEDGKTKFYAVITSMGESPLVLVLNKFTGEEINIYVVYPGNNCFLNATGPIVMYLVADTENTAINKNIIITGKELRSESWNCDEKGNFPDNVKPYGEWYRTDLAL